MKHRFAAFKVILCLVATVFLVTACETIGGHLGIHWGDRRAVDHPRVVEKTKQTGPPPHAPAHGYRAKHKYRYYSSCSVYYEVDRRLYFYFRDGDWQISASLPADLEVQLSNYVTMDLDTDRPYLYYEEHKTKYPPGKMKKKGKK